ncbi:hypothetical protein ACHAXR_006630 [Thalassiosira sp. AJA248-18]
MNQPRFSDNGSGNSWHSNQPANRRNVHSTGRSNYGGSSSRGKKKEQDNNNKKGPIGNWIQNRRQRRLHRQRSSNGGAVGTEANAIQNMARNAKHFNYPSSGFITPIEHSLLYAMIEFPEQYPEGVVKSMIEEEDFDVYLYVNDEKSKRGNNNDGSNDRGEEEEEREQQTTAAQSDANIGEEHVSYAQLSALAALSAEKFPSTATPDQTTNASSTARSSSSTNSSELPSSNNSKNSNNNDQQQQQQQISIGQALVRKLLRAITRYSDAHSLDRNTEIREFLLPIEKRCQIRNEKAALQQLLPAYAGYTLSLVTGNPLPLLIGAAALTGPDTMAEENSNISGFRAVGGRVGDLETAGLLDECESD